MTHIPSSSYTGPQWCWWHRKVEFNKIFYHFRILVTEFRSWWHLLVKTPTTSQACHQHILSPTSFINATTTLIIFSKWFSIINFFDRIYWNSWIWIDTAGFLQQNIIGQNIWNIKFFKYFFHCLIFWEWVVAIVGWIGWLKYWLYVGEHLEAALQPLQNHWKKR